MSDVLIVDDDQAVCAALQIMLEIHDISCESVHDPESAVRRVQAGGVRLVIQDMNFGRERTSGEEGVALFRKLRAVQADLPVLLLTAWTSLETAVTLVREGAVDYMGKPWDDDKLLGRVQNLLDQDQADLEDTTNVGLIYRSRAMGEAVRLALSVARADVPVLITGPNGVGKEKIAELIQSRSSRAEAPFVKVNVGAVPDELMESEFFGAEAGAFTGARQRRVGHFEAAHRGTLFLDEIGNLSRAGQMKLLRVLQSGEYQRLGSSKVQRSDVRIISATNADLVQAVTSGDFRQDLYFRLRVIEIRIPALRDRPEDIQPLAEMFLSRYAAEPKTLSPAALTALLAHPWPGNIRELENCIQRAALVSAGAEVEAADLGLIQLPQPGVDRPKAAERAESPERTQLEAVLREHDGVIAQAAKALGLSRQALYRKMEKHGIKMEKRMS